MLTDQVLKSDWVKLDAENEKDGRIGRRRRVLATTIKERMREKNRERAASETSGESGCAQIAL